MGTKHSRELTVQQLIAKGACHGQVQLFRELFGTRVDVTVQAVQSVAGKFDWDWAARNLLSAAAQAEYDKGCAAALAEYNKGCAAALAEYNKVCAAAWAEYYKVCAAAWAEYYKVCAAAQAEYNKGCAAAFATAYINDNN